MRSNNRESEIIASNGRRLGHDEKVPRIPVKDSSGSSGVINRRYSLDIADVAHIVGILNEIDHPEKEPDLSPQYDGFDKAVARMGRALKWLLPVIVLSACATVPPELEKTIVAEVTEIAGSKSFATIFDRNIIDNIPNDKDGSSTTRDTAHAQLNQVEAWCQEDFGENMVSESGMYLLAKAEDEKTYLWSFCKVDTDGEEVMMVSRFVSVDDNQGDTVSKEMVLFEDGSVGYVDGDGNHIIFQHRPGNKYDVLDIDGYVIARSEDGFWDQLMNAGVTPVAAEAPTETPVPSPTPKPEPTATATATATPTEIPLIQGDIFYDPQSKEDIKNVAEAPSPFEEAEKYALWHEEYLKQINKKLENYQGPTAEIDRMKTMINGTDAIVSYFSEKWPVAGSYWYEWNGEIVLNKTYIFGIASDGKSPVLLHVTYYPKSIAMIEQKNYNYGPLKEMVSIVYKLTDTAIKRGPNAFKIDFFDTFTRTEEELAAFKRFVFNKSEEGDETIFSQMQFICSRSE